MQGPLPSLSSALLGSNIVFVNNGSILAFALFFDKWDFRLNYCVHFWAVTNCYRYPSLLHINYCSMLYALVFPIAQYLRYNSLNLSKYISGLAG